MPPKKKRTTQAKKANAAKSDTEEEQRLTRRSSASRGTSSSSSATTKKRTCVDREDDEEPQLTRRRSSATRAGQNSASSSSSSNSTAHQKPKPSVEKDAEFPRFVETQVDGKKAVINNTEDQSVLHVKRSLGGMFTMPLPDYSQQGGEHSWQISVTRDSNIAWPQMYFGLKDEKCETVFLGTDRPTCTFMWINTYSMHVAMAIHQFGSWNQWYPQWARTNQVGVLSWDARTLETCDRKFVVTVDYTNKKAKVRAVGGLETVLYDFDGATQEAFVHLSPVSRGYKVRISALEDGESDSD
eukprot:TRINITY_DN4071_c0_g1_i1.p1 TRINITY_DN4071_c0_g1~~TRINITY_DN4071_c0_g1_i1.p1  ORF type:complete len:298 (-),score=40.63 TRINITY_DN4071_c0_g1_i1:112-1005(-)